MTRPSLDCCTLSRQGLGLALLLALLVRVGPASAGVQPDGVRRVLTLLDVVGEEYREGVRDGEAQRPIEYKEAQLFLNEAADRLGRSGVASGPFEAAFGTIRSQLDEKAPEEEVRVALGQLRQAITDATGVTVEVFPPAAPSAIRGRALFQENCTPCHGKAANGRGEDSAGLNPPPANFTDPQFMREETPYDFFQMITVGKVGSAMPAWGEVLSSQDRWDLVSYLWGVRTGSGDLTQAQGTYLSECASCHGPKAEGKGIYSSLLRRPVPDLSTVQALVHKSDSQIFATVSNGISGTPMPAFGTRLTESERWATVAYLRTLSLSGDTTSSAGPTPGGLRRLGGLLGLLADEYAKAVPATGNSDELEYQESTILLSQVQRSAAGALSELTSTAPADANAIRAKISEIAAHISHREAPEKVRSLASSAASVIGRHLEPSPAQPTAKAADALSKTEALLVQALTAYGRGDPRSRDLVSDAYFEFEPLEQQLAGTAPNLTRQVETHFLDLRGVLATPGATDRATAIVDTIRTNLENVRTTLHPRENGYALFFQSATIILREGFEVVLIIGALLAFVVKSGNERMKRPILLGASAGVALSLATAYLLTWLFEGTTGGYGEVLEGVTMLLASGVLFFVSYWLISKAEAEKWQRYIQGKVKTALVTGSGLALAGTAFLAVYREGVETVLFYQALLGTAGHATSMVLAGLAAGAAALVCVCFVFARFGMRLPIRQFFLATSLLLYYLAVVFAGKGVAELQIAGWVGVTPLPYIPRIEFLGLYPTLQTVIAQGVLLAFLVYAATVTWRRHVRNDLSVADLVVEARQLRGLLAEMRAELSPRTGRNLEQVRRLDELLTRTSELEMQMQLHFPPNGRNKTIKH